MSQKPDPRPDVLREVLTQTVADDPDLQAAARALVHDVIADARHTLRFGDARDRALLWKAVVPGMLRATQDSGSKHEDPQRIAYENLLITLGGGDPDSDTPSSPSSAT